MIESFKKDERLISGLVGTRVNPTFGVTDEEIFSNNNSNPLWNITRPGQEARLSEMCQNVGRLFDRVLDFEREKVNNRSAQGKLDDEQVKNLYSVTSETVVFMLQSFNQLKNLSQDLQTSIVTSFTENVVINQGWGEVKVKEKRKEVQLSGKHLSEKCLGMVGDKYELKQGVRPDGKHNSQGKGGLSI